MHNKWSHLRINASYPHCVAIKLQPGLSFKVRRETVHRRSCLLGRILSRQTRVCRGRVKWINLRRNWNIILSWNSNYSKRFRTGFKTTNVCSLYVSRVSTSIFKNTSLHTASKAIAWRLKHGYTIHTSMQIGRKWLDYNVLQNLDNTDFGRYNPQLWSLKSGGKNIFDECFQCNKQQLVYEILQKVYCSHFRKHQKIPVC